MKSVLYTVLLGLLCSHVNGMAYQSDLRLTVYGHTLFTVSFDGRHYPYPDYRFELRDITPGYHYLEVFKHCAVYHPAVLFSGYIHIPAGRVVNAHIDRYGRLMIISVRLKYPLPVVYPADPIYMMPVPHVLVPMSDSDFELLCASIRSKHFDSSRLQVARQALGTNYFTAYQIREIMQLLTFESSRLELAKQAYHRVVDKERYYLVYDAFTFESSIDELNHYIRRHG
jgi:hypothetical protein